MHFVSTKKFTYCKQTNTFATELSDLGGWRSFPLTQIYPDAGDVGFTLVSHKTGQEVKMVLAEDIIGQDNTDVLGWKFKPTDRKHSFEVIIFND